MKRIPPIYPYQDTEEMDRRFNEIRFDKSINLGNIISMVALLATLIVFGVKIIERMDNMEFKVNAMWQQFSISIKKD